MNIELDREDFRLWLAAKDPDEPVGTPGATTECGLANWLRESGFPEAYVCLGTWGENEDLERDLPEWAADWEQRFEYEPNPDQPGKLRRRREPLTAKQSLTVLDSLSLVRSESYTVEGS